MRTRLVILHYGDGDGLTRAVINQAVRCAKGDIHLSLVVNGGQDSELFDFPHEHWKTPAPSLAAAFNQALRLDDPECEQIAFLHSDCLVEEGWDVALAELTSVGIAAFPRVVDDPASPVPAGVPGTPPSCLWAISRPQWLACGGYDEAYQFCHFEDMDLWKRLNEQGVKLKRANLRVFHMRGYTRQQVGPEANAALLANKDVYAARWGYVLPGIIEGDSLQGKEQRT